MIPPKPMTDEWLSEIDRWLAMNRDIVPTTGRAMRDEIDRLRAENDEMYRELAASPEPIGYVAMNHHGAIAYNGVIFETADEARRAPMTPVCALIPVREENND